MRELHSTQILLKKILSQLQEAQRVRNIHVAIGEIAELDQHLLEQHWHHLSQGTPAELAQLHFRLIKAEVQCMACFEKYHPEHGKIHCPHCGSYGAKVLTGEEFYLEQIELDDN